MISGPMTRWDIAWAADEPYFPHGATMTHSLLAARGDAEVHVHCLVAPGLPSRYRDPLERMVTEGGGEIRFVEVPDSWVDSLPSTIAKTGWYTMFLPGLLPDVDRVLYVDVDAIVLDSLDELFRIDFEGNHVGAVTNVFESYYAHRPAELGLSGPEVYFNAGIMLLNLELMRQDDCTAELDEFARTRPNLLWYDQDVFNGVLSSRRLALHPRWNAMNSLFIFPWSSDVYGEETAAEARRNPAIRHFEGPSVNKPWHFLCEREMRELYVEHRRQTPWPRYRPAGITPGNVVRRVRRDLLGHRTPPVPDWVRP